MATADTTGGDNVKKRALIRLGVAGVITAVALGGLWLLDRRGEKPAESKPATPKPIVSAPQPEPPPPPAEPEQPATEEPVAAEHTLPANSQEPSVETAPPPAVQALPAPPPPRVRNDASLPPPRVQTAPSPAPKPATNSQEPPPRAAMAPEFTVQLGVFSNPANAQDLVQRLNRQGIRAYSETRVYVGPFLNHQEAEKARAELARQGLKGVVAEGAKP